jgi:hypothetical protein
MHRLVVFDATSERDFEVLSEHLPRVNDFIWLADSVWTVICVDHHVHHAAVPIGTKDLPWTRIVVDDERPMPVPRG